MTRGPAIVWVGFHEEGRFALPAIIQADFDVTAVLTLIDESAARRSGCYDFAEAAARCGIPCHKIDHINDAASLAVLESLEPDVICVIGWSQILSPEALAKAPWVIGAHASLLPEGKGSAPVNWALIKGMKRTGNTLIRLAEGVDDGDILAQRAFDIRDDDTCATLYDKVAETNAEMLVEVLGQIRDGTIDPRPQPATDKPLWPRRRPEDGRIDWTQSNRQVYDFVRALTRPYPGAFTFVDGRKVLIWRASLTDVAANGMPGEVVGSRDSAILVACSRGCVALHEIETEDDGVLEGTAMIEHLSHTAAFDVNGD